MTFSTGLYHQNVAPAQIDVRLQAPIQAPILQNQARGLELFFGKGLEVFSEIFEQREKYKTQMAQIAQENDRRAAELVAGGISSTDAINMAWEENRYKEPKTWGEVGKQNAIADLASKANNGWIGGQSSAITLETAMAQLEAFQRDGIDGIPLEDMDWINGDGLRKLVELTRPSPEVMIALGPNAPGVRNKILNRIVHLSDVYTEKQRQSIRNLEIAGRTADMANMVQDIISGEQIDDETINSVNKFIKSYPDKVNGAATNILKNVLWESSHNGDISNAEELIPLLQPFALRFGIDLEGKEMTDFIRESAIEGNNYVLTDRKEMMNKADMQIEALPPEQKTKENISMIFDGVGFTKDMYDAGDDATVLNNASNIVVSLKRMELDIEEGSRSVADGINLLSSISDSVPFKMEWEENFKDARGRFESKQRGISSLALQMKRDRRDNWTPIGGYYGNQIDKTFSTKVVHDIGDEQKSLTQGASDTATLFLDRKMVDIRRDYVNGIITEEEGEQAIQDLMEITIEGLQLNPNSFVQLSPEQQPEQQIKLTGGMRVR